MRKALLSAMSAFSLLAACGEQAANEAANTAATNQAEPANEVANTVVSNDSAVPAQPKARENPARAVGPLGAAVAGRRAGQLMHDRHEGMEDIGDAFKLVSREVRNDSPDLARLREGAGAIARLAPQGTGWFPPGTGPDIGKTRAKAEIWQKPEDFAAKRAAFQRSARAFDAAARGGDLAAIRAAHADLGKTCNACHDSYRAPED